ncbi:MAG: hypothetical protein KDA61_20925, partial [Planctomycetales bacterium]|nr:hypothetical protein [Planctomycetales bacterium]
WRVAEEDSQWRLRYEIAFTTAEEDASVRIAIPATSNSYEVVDQEFSEPGLDSTQEVGALTGTREWRVRARHLDPYLASAEFDIRLPAGDFYFDGESPIALSSDARARFLRADDFLPTQSPNVQRALQEAPKGDASQGELLQWAFERCSQDMRATTADEGGDDVGFALEANRATDLGRARAMVTICRALRIPSRLVTGFELRQEATPQPRVWVEAYLGHQWLPFAPQFGFARRLPRNFVPVRRGGETIVQTQGVKDGTLATNFRIVRLPPPVAALRKDVRRPSQIVDLTRLPVEMHHILSLMLLLPFAALVAAVFRNIVGIRTFGTFSPALLAISFLYAAWGTGLLILSMVIGFGVVGRTLLERLQLLMVPRLSIILTVIILCVVFGVSFLDYMEVTPSAQAVLLPMVILTTMIERLYVAAEEDGLAFSIQLAAGTLVVAACAYLVVSWDAIGRLILIYPEIHFLSIAAFIFIGRYSGYRLAELIRFRDLAKTESRPQ